MKRTIEQMIALCAVALLPASCAKEAVTESVIPAGYEEIVFSAETEITKTSISGDGAEKTVNWVEGDEIKIFYDGGSVTSTAASSGTSTSFSAVLPEEVGNLYGVYPSTAATFSEGSFNVSIPAVQEGAFANGNMSVACLHKDAASYFKNVTSFIKVIVSDAEYTKVVIGAVAGESIAGNLAVTLDGDNPVIGEVSDGASEITLNVSEAGTYYVAIVPGTRFTKGILATYYKGTEPAGSYFLDGDIVIERSRIASVGTLEERIGDYYASPEGAGAKSGKNEANAMDLATLKAFINASSDADKLAAQAAALNGATIHLAAGTYDFEELVTLKYGSAVKLTFAGAENATSVISGNDTHRILLIGDGADVFFDNVEFTHGLGPESSVPSMLSEEGTNVKLTDCKVTYCKNYSGGGYHSLGGVVAKGNIVVDKCEFANNGASYGASLSVYADATVTNSNFHDNLGVKGPGNSIYVATAPASVSSHVVYVEKCYFTDNTTSGSSDGGALSSCDGTTTVKDCVFSGNVNESKGGSCTYMWNGAVVNYDNCTFTNCKSGNLTASLGGAIYAKNSSKPTFTNCTFTNCEAYRGGAIYSESTSSDGVTVTGCTFTGCYTPDEGAGVDVRAGKGTINNCTFIENISPWGAVYVGGTGSVIDINGGIFKENVAKNRDNSAKTGAAISAGDGTTVRCNAVVFDGNKASSGPVFSNENGNFTAYFNACTFKENNWSDNYGGMMKIKDGDKSNNVLCLNNCSGNHNYSNGSGKTGQQCTWINLPTNNGIKFVIANTSFIGNLQDKNGNVSSSSSGSAPGIIRIDYKKATEVQLYMVNNILMKWDANTNYGVASTIETYAAQYCNYNKGQCRSISVSDGSPSEPNGYFDSSGRSKSNFGSLKWDNDSNLWTWNGENSGSKYLGATADINAAISSADSDFYAWLVSIGAISSDGATAVDARGTTRGLYSWPGSYDKGDKTGPNAD